MISEYRESDWMAVCELYDKSKPLELECGGARGSFIPLAEDSNRTAEFRNSSIFVYEEGGRLLGFAGHDGDYIGWLFVETWVSRIRRAACVFSPGFSRMPLGSFNKAPLQNSSAQDSLNPWIMTPLLP